MVTIYYSIADLLFGGGLIDSIVEWMDNVFTALDGIASGSLMTNIVQIFSAVCVSLLLVYFFLDVANNASKDMFTLEKFVIMIIRLYVAVIVIICLPELLKSFMDFGSAMYRWCSSTEFMNNLFGSNGESDGLQFVMQGHTYSSLPSKAEIEDAGIWNFRLSKVLDYLGVLIIALVAMLIQLVVKLIAYFLTTSNAITIVTRAVFSPLAVCQLFEDGSRSVGVRYLKTLVVECLVMTVMVITLRGAQIFTGYMISYVYQSGGIGSEGVIDLAKLDDFITISHLAPLLLPQIACIGGIMGANKIARDVIM